jgi:hypothetical protein
MAAIEGKTEGGCEGIREKLGGREERRKRTF